MLEGPAGFAMGLDGVDKPADFTPDPYSEAAIKELTEEESLTKPDIVAVALPMVKQ